MKRENNNALWNCKNPYQGRYTKVLTVCSAGLLRSATIAWYLTRETDANCRNAGINDYALVLLDNVLIEWADIIICSDKEKEEAILREYEDQLDGKPIYTFDIPDKYGFRDPDMLEIIKQRVHDFDLVEKINNGHY